ncbi:sulfurtransferase [Ekhidna sp.]|jgi:thiosulfate/3-mercaptopyruvate sulfurtransferase|uniref:sulfurtransferase n=1 Tax=Ekhidna sp. TaxID=2608089 RepID=UPI0032ED740D
MKKVVDINWLEQHLDDPELVILDASQSTSVNKQENAIQGKYIPGSHPFSLQEFSDQKSELPNTLPTPEYFERKCRDLGINSTSKIVVYDNAGVYWSPRVWWLFHVMGHEEVAVLNGGLSAWIKANQATTESLSQANQPGNFKANFNKELVKSIQDINQNLTSQSFHVVDARSKGRFDGTAPEPREGLKSGHIPNSLNIPYEDVLNEGYFKSPDKLKELFKHTSSEEILTFSCGSGLTACIVSLAHSLISDKISPVYDGSWTEWAQSGSPINTKES